MELSQADGASAPICLPVSKVTARSKLIKIISKIHGCIYRASKGKIGRRLGNQEIVLLTTKGRKSGRERQVPLAAIPHLNNYFVVASFGGSHVHPGWFLNIRHNQNVRVRFGATTKRATASILQTSAIDYEHLWNKAISIYKGFDDYKEATPRRIPIVIITPHHE